MMIMMSSGPNLWPLASAIALPFVDLDQRGGFELMEAIVDAARSSPQGRSSPSGTTRSVAAVGAIRGAWERTIAAFGTRPDGTRYLRYIGIFEADMVGAAGEIANVSHTLKPEARSCASNSP